MFICSLLLVILDRCMSLDFGEVVRCFFLFCIWDLMISVSLFEWFDMLKCWNGKIVIGLLKF